MDNISQAIPTFTSGSLARLQLLQGIPADTSLFNGNTFSLDALKAIEKELKMYKEIAEKNLANCDRVQEQVDHFYKKKKEQDKTRNKLIKKQDSYSGSFAALRVWRGVGSQCGPYRSRRWPDRCYMVLQGHWRSTRLLFPPRCDQPSPTARSHPEFHELLQVGVQDDFKYHSRWISSSWKIKV